MQKFSEFTFILQNSAEYFATKNKQQTTNNKEQTTKNKQQTTNNKQQTATKNKQQTTNSNLQQFAEFCRILNNFTEYLQKFAEI